MIKFKSLNRSKDFIKILREKKEIDLNYTYVIFGKNNVYKDEFAFIFREVNSVFKKIKQTGV